MDPVVYPICIALILVLFTSYALLMRWARRGAPLLDTSSAAMFHGANTLEAKVPNHCINVCLYFKAMPTKDEVLKSLKEDLVNRNLEFRALPTETWKGILWKEVPTDVADHMICSEVSSEEQLQEQVDIITRANIRDFPKRLWELHYINNTGGRGMLIFRIEHCIGDGLSLMKLFVRMITDEEGKPFQMPTMQQRPVKSKGKGILHNAMNLLQSIWAANVMTQGPFDSNTPFCPWKGATPVFCCVQEVAVIPRHPLQLVRDIKDKAGATVNDVVFSCLAGAVRRYLEAQGLDADVEAMRMRALVPFAFPQKSEKLCNSWAFVSIPLLVNEKTPESRLQKTIEAWLALKQTLLAPVMLFITTFLTGLLPIAMTRSTATGTLARHSVVVSNVPGPDRPVKVCGALLDGVLMVYRNLVPQVSVLSYNGELFGNFVVDPSFIKDPQSLAAFYLEELRALAKVYGVDASF